MFGLGLTAAAIVLLRLWLRPHSVPREDDVGNGTAKKQATDDTSALAQRLSIVEARLGVVEAALRLDTTEPVAGESPAQRAAALRLDTTEPVAGESPAQRARIIGWLAMVMALIVGVGIVSVRARG
jgi:hypothetical protein